jgi:hypothetical protein
VLVRPWNAATSLVKMAAAAAAGAPIAPNADGKGRTAVSGEKYYGRLAQAATADGDIVEMQIADGIVP